MSDPQTRSDRLDQLLASPLDALPALREFLLPDGPDSGPRPWLPQLPEATEQWEAEWDRIGKVMLEQLASAAGDTRDALFAVIAVCPTPETVTLARSVVTAQKETPAIQILCMDLLVQGLGPEAAPILTAAAQAHGSAGAVRAVENLAALPPSVHAEELGTVASSSDAPRVARMKAAQPSAVLTSAASVKAADFW